MPMSSQLLIKCMNIITPKLSSARFLSTEMAIIISMMVDCLY